MFVLGGDDPVADGQVLDRGSALHRTGDHSPVLAFFELFTAVLPEHQSALLGTPHHESSLTFIFYFFYFIVLDFLVEEGQHVVLVVVQMPETDHVFVRAGAQETVPHPQGNKLFRVPRDRQFDFFLRGRNAFVRRDPELHE